MPYIKGEKRNAWGHAPHNAGELNYRITTCVLNYVVSQPKRYQTFNDAIGALESAKLELYRRMIAPYEDSKIQENGDLPGYLGVLHEGHR